MQAKYSKTYKDNVDVSNIKSGDFVKLKYKFRDGRIDFISGYITVFPSFGFFRFSGCDIDYKISSILEIVSWTANN